MTNLLYCTTEVKREDQTHIKATLTNKKGVSISVIQKFANSTEASHHIRQLKLLPTFDIAQRIAHCVVGGKLI